MIKLFMLEDISSFSSDAEFKIFLALEEKGLTQENVEKFGTYDELLDAIVPALENGDHIIITPENSDYNVVKRDIIGKLILEEYSSPVIAEAIATNAGEDLSEIDMSGHSLVPANSTCLITTDGLFCGFTTSILAGKLTCMPLDFLRVDLILEQLREKVIEREERLLELGLDTEIQMPDYDLVPTITELVGALDGANQTIALATGEATMWIYNLFDKVENLTKTINFVEIVDDESADFSNETESAMIIRHAREAMLNLGTDYGAAISDIYSTENAEGKTVYFAYAALVDTGTAKAKKINISDPNNLAIVLPHAVTLLSEMVCKKVDANTKALAVIEKKEQEETDVKETKPQQIVLSNKLVLFLICAVVAIVLPIVLVFTVFDKDEPTTQAFNPSYNPTSQSSTTESTTAYNPFVSQNTTLNANGQYVTEPSAADISATQTTTGTTSQSGVFTFYCFGYGHGVGMSQIGANSLAKSGWTYAEILSHYYCDGSGNTKIVTGDTYPEKITYAGSAYETREYLAKALEAEMGASFHFEALKAQAIAIYTFAKHYSYNLSRDAHAFTANTPSSTVYAAVDFVIQNGFYISYSGDVALTPYHSMSAGKTTSYYNVWGKGTNTSVPYLSGGRSSYGDYESANFKSVFTITSADLKKLIEDSNLGVTLSGDPATWISILTHDQAVREDIGYISTINVGGKIITGYDFRISVMQGKIRSHCFAMTYTPDFS